MYGHWKTPENFDPNDHFGFVYKITNRITGQSYIGKKNLWSRTRKTVKGKTRKQVTVSPSDWRTYTSSSNQLNQAIEASDKDLFDFQILSVHKTNQELDFAEVRTQWELDVIRAKFPDGTKKYYNGRIERLNFNQFTADKVRFIA